MDVRLVTGLNVVIAITLSEEEGQAFSSGDDEIVRKMRGSVHAQMLVLSNIRKTLSMGGS